MKLKKQAALFFVMLLPFLCSGLSSQDSLGSKRVYLGISVSSYRLKVFSMQDFYQPFYNSNYTQLVPLRFGIDVKIRLLPGLSISSGALMDVQRAGLSTFGPFGVQAQVTQYSFEVPLRADLRFSKKHFSPLLTVGAALDVFYMEVEKYKVTTSSGNVVGSTDTFYFQKNGDSNQIRPLLQLGFGVDASFRAFKLQAFPLYECGLLKNYSMQGGHVYYHRAGLMLSLCHTL